MENRGLVDTSKKPCKMLINSANGKTKPVFADRVNSLPKTQDAVLKPCTSTCQVRTSITHARCVERGKSLLKTRTSWSILVWLDRTPAAVLNSPCFKEFSLRTCARKSSPTSNANAVSPLSTQVEDQLHWGFEAQ